MFLRKRTFTMVVHMMLVKGVFKRISVQEPHYRLDITTPFDSAHLNLFAEHGVAQTV